MMKEDIFLGDYRNEKICGQSIRRGSLIQVISQSFQRRRFNSKVVFRTFYGISSKYCSKIKNLHSFDLFQRGLDVENEGIFARTLFDSSKIFFVSREVDSRDSIFSTGSIDSSKKQMITGNYVTNRDEIKQYCEENSITYLVW